MVYAENFSATSDIKWLRGKVTKITGPLSYVIELSDGNTVRHHVDHIKARENDQDDVQNPERDDTNWDYVDTDSSQSTELSTDNNTTESTLCQSTRICKTPQRFDQSP